MNFIRFCLKNPVFASVGGIFILLFGCISWYKIPYQLLPQTTRPVISIYTAWSGASPYEIEKEITQKQEKYLKNLPKLVSMTSTSRDAMAIIHLEFELGTDLKTAFLNVSSKLEEVGNYHQDIQKPIIKTTGESIPIAVYLFAKTKDPNQNIDTYKNFIHDNILQYYERIEGVGEVYMSGGTTKQAQIFLNVQQLAFNNITISEVIKAINAQNLNISSGNIDFDQRSYRIQTIGKYTSIEDILNTFIKVQNGKSVRLKDIADVKMGYEKKTSYNIHNSDNVISIQIRPSASANILDLTNKVRDLTQKLNDTLMAEQNLSIDWGRDQQGFILNAIKQVKQSVVIGIILSIGILFVFLRNIVSLFIISLIIPLSIIGTFVVLYIFGRTLNVISLAGISFAISMVIDCGIVVLESIIRNQHKRTNPFEATFIGVKEVVGALFASSITTIGIFIPIIYLKDEAGQLFADIAFASSGAIIIAFIVCIFIIPALLLIALPKHKTQSKLSQKIGDFGEMLATIILKLVCFCIKTPFHKIACIVIFLGTCIAFSIMTFPKLDYMPKGSQNFIISYLSTPPGLSLNEKYYIVHLIQQEIAPFLEQNGYEQSLPSNPPVIEDFFISADNSMYFYLVAKDPKKAKDLIPFAKQIINKIPNVSGVVLQQEIFSSQSSSSIDLNISGYNLESITQAAHKLQTLISQKFPDISVRVIPALTANNREINLYPNSFAFLQNKLDIDSFGDILNVALNGKTLGDVRLNNEYIDLVLKSSQAKNQSPEDILFTQIYTPSGKIVTLGSLVNAKNKLGISTIRHFEQKRNILLILNPSSTQPLESIIQTLQDEILTPAHAEFPYLTFSLNGNADKLSLLKSNLSLGFLLAVMITYLILCALYESFIYPFFIILSVPFAITGGLIGLFIVNRYIDMQNLDAITMLGFIILVGSVVNNAILIIYQARINYNEYKMPWQTSVLDSTKTRLAPIYMSMLTSVLALLPLVIFSGDGSEIYRGLGAILIGGLAFSTLISVFIIPVLLLLWTPKRAMTYKNDTISSYNKTQSTN
ncbi:transmembrane Acr-type transport protein [Helicobacter fennelliae]|uniref:Transmembrane Acr-type transport protein n=1 Tax=Helicobacter fennelliae TaxID=215 RepID=A0A2X3B0G8_9HELI|nr:efflux RND transporter permease subunit [Helicobacter fennelliae]SQB98678.1 transmembrane Acr-type transport protein [Helicobacter fennelliae]